MAQSALSSASARDIILEIVRNMQQGLEPLRHTSLPPTIYRVYLHPQDLDRISGIIPRILDEAKKALTAEITRMNRPSLKQKLGMSPALPVESPGGGWTVELLENTDDGTGPGDIVIYSELALPSKPEYAGSMTKRTETRRLGRAPEPSQAAGAGSGSEPEVFATLEYEDETGRQTYRVTKNQIVIGRGGRDYWTDLTLHTLPDVSREHLRLRRDPATGNFFLKDLSRLGTTINGQKTPSSVEETAGQRKDKNLEVELPRKARIGLADVMFLDFEARSGK
jgi:hypothetical protein